MSINNESYVNEIFVLYILFSFVINGYFLTSNFWIDFGECHFQYGIVMAVSGVIGTTFTLVLLFKDVLCCKCKKDVPSFRWIIGGLNILQIIYLLFCIGAVAYMILNKDNCIEDGLLYSSNVLNIIVVLFGIYYARKSIERDNLYSGNEYCC